MLDDDLMLKWMDKQDQINSEFVILFKQMEDRLNKLDSHFHGSGNGVSK